MFINYTKRGHLQKERKLAPMQEIFIDTSFVCTPYL